LVLKIKIVTDQNTRAGIKSSIREVYVKPPAPKIPPMKITGASNGDITPENGKCTF